MTVEVYASTRMQKHSYIVTSNQYSDQRVGVVQYDSPQNNKRVHLSVNDSTKLTKEDNGEGYLSGQGAWLDTENIIELIYVLKIALKEQGVNVDDC